MDLDRLPTTELSAITAFRYSNYDTPFWARNNRTEGRWHRVGDGATQYLSLHPDAAWADLARHEQLKTVGELTLVRMTIWAVEVSQGRLVDYSTFEKAEAAGFAACGLVDDDYTECQDHGRALRGAGYAGVVAPSAALPGAVNVTLFGPRVRSTWGMPTRLASAVPCCVVAVGSPPPHLAARVRHVGAGHVALEAFRRTEHIQGSRPDAGQLHLSADSDADESPPGDPSGSG